jgi:YHS domain-containing protein
MMFLAALAAPVQAAALVNSVVTDPLTGVALEGYDPVTYFTEAEPQPGSPNFEYVWAGVPWYFVSAANRDVFKRAPEVYAPQHGGHCEMSLARGYLSDGKPKIFAIEKMKLYLFYSAANREAFLLAQSEAIVDAAVNWQRLSVELLGPAPGPDSSLDPADPAVQQAEAEPDATESPAVEAAVAEIATAAAEADEAAASH